MTLLGSCHGHLEDLQHSTLIYGYIEAVVWGVLTGSLLLFTLVSICCKGGRRDPNDVYSCSCNYLVLVLVVCGVVQVIFDVALIEGLQHQNSGLVLSYFIFGVISDILRVPLCVVMLVVNGQSGPDRVDHVTRGFSIAGLIYSVVHCGVLYVVFKSYLQIKAFPHCLL